MHVDPRASAPPWRYRVLLGLASLPIIAHLMWRGMRDGDARYVFERLGFTAAAPAGVRWVHAASVGELLTVMPLLRACLEQHQHSRLLVSTTTPTAARLLERESEPRLHHVYLPIDWPGATARFLDRVAPVSGWIVETEIWPWLYARCHARGVPLTLINGRISARTHAQRQGILRQAYARALETVEVLARTDVDAKRFADLGARRIRTIGNLKFADNRPHTTPARPVGMPYCLLASSHADEETAFAEAWLGAKATPLLVIAPRHPERGGEIKRRLDTLYRPVSAAGVRQRSKGEEPLADDRLYLADTLGEMQAWYAHAEAVAVGGSWAAVGGHNVLEPARYGKAIVVGPHMQNFEDALHALQSQDAICSGTTASEAVAILQHFLECRTDAQARGQRAKQVSLAAGRVVSDYLAVLGVAAA